MNSNSYICKFIEEHPEDWESILKNEYSISVRKEGDLAIFVYGYDCNFHDPVVQEARGIIINYVTREVVCWPFRKFGNFSESYADEIDWSSARVLEKVDGSIIKLWYDFARDGWQFSTNGTIRAENATLDSCVGVVFGDIIKRADNYGDIPFNNLDRNKTYIFELVSPETKIVINYGATSLYHIGTRSNLTGMESEENIGIKKPRSFPLGSLEECRKAAAELNTGEGDEVTDEGFVVVDGRWHRVKVKSADYIMKHRLINIKTVSKRDCLDMIIGESEDMAAICRENPHLVPLFKYYDFKLSELKYMANELTALARRLFDEYGQDRRAVASVISRHPLSGIGYRAIDRMHKSGEEILLDLPLEKLAKLIEDYKPYDIKSLFTEGEE